MWVAQQVLCFETPSPLHSLDPYPEQTDTPAYDMGLDTN